MTAVVLVMQRGRCPFRPGVQGGTGGITKRCKRQEGWIHSRCGERCRAFARWSFKAETRRVILNVGQIVVVVFFLSIGHVMGGFHKRQPVWIAPDLTNQIFVPLIIDPWSS